MFKEVPSCVSISDRIVLLRVTQVIKSTTTKCPKIPHRMISFDLTNKFPDDKIERTATLATILLLNYRWAPSEQGASNGCQIWE